MSNPALQAIADEGGPYLEITPVSPHIQSIMNEMCRPRVTLEIVTPRWKSITWRSFIVEITDMARVIGWWQVLKGLVVTFIPAVRDVLKGDK